MKYSGKIGFAETVETKRGIWTEQITEKPYTGDIVKLSRRLVAGEGTNDDVSVSNEISIIADPYALNNFVSIRYATYMGQKLKVTNVSVNYPRLSLILGGLYHEDA